MQIVVNKKLILNLVIFLFLIVIPWELVFSSEDDLYVDAAPSGWSCTVRSAASFTAVSVSCSGSEKVVEGGCVFNSTIGAAGESRPTGQGWYCSDPNNGSLTAYANCCS
jgi:hypothetical protein